MARVFLLCGLPGAGKTTVAREIEREELDSWFDHFEAPTPEELALNDA
jgi:adenylate kinase family enzyme